VLGSGKAKPDIRRMCFYTEYNLKSTKSRVYSAYSAFEDLVDLASALAQPSIVIRHLQVSSTYDRTRGGGQKSARTEDAKNHADTR
jgi:hypothetical protein